MADGVRAVFITAERRDRGHLLPFPLWSKPAYHRHHLRLRAVPSSKTGLRPVYRSVMLVMAVFFMLLPVFTGFSEIESTIARWRVTARSTCLSGYSLADISFCTGFRASWCSASAGGMVTLGVLLVVVADSSCARSRHSRRKASA